MIKGTYILRTLWVCEIMIAEIGTIKHDSKSTKWTVKKKQIHNDGNR